MRDALVSDFSAITDVEIVTTYDARLSLASPSANMLSLTGNGSQVVSIDDVFNARSIWQEMLQGCDAALVVAPESGAVLTNLTQLVETRGVKNLGCAQTSVDTASNKYKTFHTLNHADVLTISTYSAHEFLRSEFNTPFDSGYIAKPIDGAGCEETVYFTAAKELQAWLCSRLASGMQEYIVQPYQTGIPASISMLCKQGKAWVLSCNQQKIEMQAVQANASPIQYKGCYVNGLSMYREAFAKLADSIAAAMPGLHGYVGVDVIICDGDIYVVEVNPRITTSYIGLRESLGYNPAQLILDLAYNPTFKLPENMASKMVDISVNA